MAGIARCFMRHLYFRPSLISLGNFSGLDPALSPYPCNFSLFSTPRPFACLINASQLFHSRSFPPNDLTTGTAVSSSFQIDRHPWPEWSKFVQSLTSRGYLHEKAFYHRTEWNFHPEDAFIHIENLQEEFLTCAKSCLALARDRPNLIRSLSRKDIEVLVQNGEPYLFQNTDESKQLLQAFVRAGESNGFELDYARTVDLMKYLISYASNPTIISDQIGESIQSSVRNLLRELDCVINSTPPENLQLPGRNGGPPYRRHQIEMKKGDWICPKCNFMNFARNFRCLECEETRPKRALSGGEWECPQCDYFNYSSNMVCVRCECRRPTEVIHRSLTTRPGEIPGQTSLTHGPKTQTNNSPMLDSRAPADVVNTEMGPAGQGSVRTGKMSAGTEAEPLDMSEEAKAERWFKRVAQIKDISELSEIPDEDFPSIMPLRKGVNRFVVSRRKTPLERRLTSAQYRTNQIVRSGSNE